MNNLKQIGLANLSYESAHTHFPPASISRNPNVPIDLSERPGDTFGSQVTALVFILPFIEQGNLDAIIDADRIGDTR